MRCIEGSKAPMPSLGGWVVPAYDRDRGRATARTGKWTVETLENWLRQNLDETDYAIDYHGYNDHVIDQNGNLRDTREFKRIRCKSDEAFIMIKLAC